MEKLNKFLGETSLWLIFPIFWALTGLLSWLVFFIMDYFCNNLYFFNGMTNIRHLTFIIVLGIPFGIFFTFGLFVMRQSKIFWDYAKEVEKLIYERNTLEGLKMISENDFDKLCKMTIGGVNSRQKYELIRLYGMIELKYEMLNKLTHEQKI